MLVTGATGFLGSHITRRLIEAGHTPRLLVRSPAKIPSVLGRMGLDPDHYEVARGDITDAASVAAAVDGCDAAVHAAAVVAIDAGRSAEMERTNLTGARNVLDTAVAAGCDPVVHVSSVAALFPFETDPVTPDHPIRGDSSVYGRTKASCERHARSLQDQGAPVITLLPSGIIGPDDWTGSVNRQSLEMFLKLGMPIVRGYAGSYVDVRDLAAVVVACMSPGGRAMRLLAMGTHVTAGEQLEVMSEAIGRRVRRLPVPRPAWWVWAKVGDVTSRLGQDIVMTSDAYDYIFRSRAGDDSATEAATGVQFRPLVDTFRDTFRWLVEAGIVDSRLLGESQRP